jgi:hypothetical protein
MQPPADKQKSASLQKYKVIFKNQFKQKWHTIRIVCAIINAIAPH